MSIAADYEFMPATLARRSDSMRRMIAACERAKRPIETGDRPDGGSGRDGAAGAALLGQILGWNPASLKGGATGNITGSGPGQGDD